MMKVLIVASTITRLTSCVGKVATMVLLGFFSHQIINTFSRGRYILSKKKQIS
jgi:hypothetical protein